VATIALFIALGGASYAAVKLPKNSVGTKQLKKNSVGTTKIKNESVTAEKVQKGTLTGAQINSSTLGTVPTAKKADTASTADMAERADTASIATSITSPEPWHYVGAPGEPQFQHDCKNSDPDQPVRFYIDHESVVHLEGRYDSCTGIGPFAFQLPAGYRPGSILQFFSPGSGLGTAILPTRDDNPSLSGGVGCGAKECFLAGLTFRAES